MVYCISGCMKSGNKYGGIAQLGEHLPCKQGVRSSNLLISTIPGTKSNPGPHLENRIMFKS